MQVTIDISKPENALKEVQSLQHLLTAMGTPAGGTTAAAASPSTIKKTRAKKAAPVVEETFDDNESDAEIGANDDDPSGMGLDFTDDESATDDTPAMTFEEFRSALRAIKKPDLVVKMLATQFKVKNIAELRPEQYEKVIASAKKLA